MLKCEDGPVNASPEDLPASILPDFGHFSCEGPDALLQQLGAPEHGSYMLSCSLVAARPEP